MPAYLSPDAKITKVITGLMYLSGAREDRNEPTSTAGTDPMMTAVVSPNCTCPNSSAPSAGSRRT